MGSDLDITKIKIKNLLWPLLMYALFAALIFVERTGIQYSTQNTLNSFIPTENLVTVHPQAAIQSLVLYNSLEEYSPHENIAFVLSEMQVGYRMLDISYEEIPSWNEFKTVILALNDLDAIQDHLLSLLAWTKEGGRTMQAQPPLAGTALGVIGAEFGMRQSNWTYAPQNQVEFLTDFMPGGKGLVLDWIDSETGILRYGLNTRTENDCIVHMRSKGEFQIDMLWERKIGKGKVVFINNDAAFNEWSRGMVASAYSLLNDVTAWPVINASMFFVDDFPAPVPDGYNPYIDRDYGTTIENFYVNVWLPDMLEIANRFKLKYTGMVIETYGDDVEPPYKPADNTARFLYFGNMFLAEGFEIGMHGYNHMSLVLEDFDYKGYLDYNKWKSVGNMAQALQEAYRFSESLFPNVDIKTYIPPSNVLSTEGRAMLKDNFPQVNAISSLYLDDYYGLSQEFGVGEDGLIEIPRIASGYELKDWDIWTILNELSIHCVNSHFIHPDDTLDPERGADLGWEQLKEGYEEYIQWLYTAMPNLRNATAQEGAMAVQRFANLFVQTKADDGVVTLDIDGFYDEAWLFVRINAGEPQQVIGGELQHVSDDLYLLKAQSSRVEIILEEWNS